MAKNINDKEQTKKLVLARLQVLPGNRRISIGSQGSFNKQELIESVEQGNKVGQKITDIQLNYLQSLKWGIFYD